MAKSVLSRKELDVAKYEIWSNSSFQTTRHADHVVEADNFDVVQGVYLFYNAIGQRLHAIVASPGVLVKKADGN